MAHSQTNVKTERTRGLGRKTREKVEKGNQTAMGFQTVGWGGGGEGETRGGGGEQKTTPASLLGFTWKVLQNSNPVNILLQKRGNT